MLNYTGIRLPPPVKTRGRPKGHTLTAIGLPAKRAKKGRTISKLCSFSKLHVTEKQKSENLHINYSVDQEIFIPHYDNV